MRKYDKVWLGGGLSCLVCGAGANGIAGYAPNKTVRGHWKASVKTLPCRSCGFDFPTKITKKQFDKFIAWRDKMGSTMDARNHALYASVLNLF